MSEKSELSYLLEALDGSDYCTGTNIRDAIERRKQDLAKVEEKVDSEPNVLGDTTGCWNCSVRYDMHKKKCPQCGLANANVNPDLAMWQQGHPVDNTPKGGGDDLSKRLRNWMTNRGGSEHGD